MTAKAPLLSVENLSRSFGGHKAVDRVSFDLPDRSIGGLIGPNGAGKTTLFNCLAGLYTPSAGKVRLAGADITGFPPHRVFARGLARTFQIPRPFPQMTVLENVMVAVSGQSGEVFWNNWFRPGLVGLEERKNLEKSRYWLDFVGLQKLEHQPASVLSGGQRKLLELARVMVSSPRLILLDEPGAGVNPALLDQIVDRIVALNRQGMTFLVIEHNMDLVTSICQPVMVMAQGQMLRMGDAQSVLRDPQVIEAYLGDVYEPRGPSQG